MISKRTITAIRVRFNNRHCVLSSTKFQQHLYHTRNEHCLVHYGTPHAKSKVLLPQRAWVLHIISNILSSANWSGLQNAKLSSVPWLNFLANFENFELDSKIIFLYSCVHQNSWLTTHSCLLGSVNAPHIDFRLLLKLYFS